MRLIRFVTFFSTLALLVGASSARAQAPQAAVIVEPRHPATEAAARATLVGRGFEVLSADAVDAAIAFAELRRPLDEAGATALRGRLGAHVLVWVQLRARGDGRMYAVTVLSAAGAQRAFGRAPRGALAERVTAELSALGPGAAAAPVGPSAPVPAAPVGPAPAAPAGTAAPATQPEVGPGTPTPSGSEARPGDPDASGAAVQPEVAAGQAQSPAGAAAGEPQSQVGGQAQSPAGAAAGEPQPQAAVGFGQPHSAAVGAGEPRSQVGPGQAQSQAAVGLAGPSAPAAQPAVGPSAPAAADVEPARGTQRIGPAQAAAPTSNEAVGAAAQDVPPEPAAPAEPPLPLRVVIAAVGGIGGFGYGVAGRLELSFAGLAPAAADGVGIGFELGLHGDWQDVDGQHSISRFQIPLTVYAHYRVRVDQLEFGPRLGGFAMLRFADTQGPTASGFSMEASVGFTVGAHGAFRVDDSVAVFAGLDLVISSWLSGVLSLGVAL